MYQHTCAQPHTALCWQLLQQQTKLHTHMFCFPVTPATASLWPLPTQLLVPLLPLLLQYNTTPSQLLLLLKPPWPQACPPPL